MCVCVFVCVCVCVCVFVCVCVCVCVYVCVCVRVVGLVVFFAQINRIVAEIRAARQKRGNNKYDYDSDEDVQDGTWEHKLRAREMIETEGKAT